MRKNKLLSTLLLLSFSTHISAHNVWVVPSQTLLSGDSAWVTFDAAASNQLFVANHAALTLDDFHILSPKKEPIALKNASKGKVRSTFDLQLTETGTYQIGRHSEMLFARYKDKASGENRRWRGTLEDYEQKKYPKNIDPKEISYFSGQLETFVTLGQPSHTVTTPSKTGLDVKYLTHPNELYAGEKADFQLMIDGVPAASQLVTVIAGNSQYRNSPNAIKVTTDKDGKFSITWPKAAMYWLNVDVEDNKSSLPNGIRILSYTAILQVFLE